MKKINNGELRTSNINEEVTLYGFVANKRKLGGVTFIDLRDRWGITQVVTSDEIGTLTKESVLEIKGTVVARQENNPDLPTGEIEIKASSIVILSEASQIPFVIRDDLEAKEDTRLRHRYLDLRRPVMQNNLIVRHRVLKAVRDFLDEKEFIEIETPILSKSTPEGARDFLVPTRKEGHFFALPQSPQMYKQLLMASGFERYYQIARVFRDEDSRKDRQPEFTHLDMEMSYTNPEQIKSTIEEMFRFVFDKLNLEISGKFERMDYDVAMDNYGNDKPDTRFKNKLIESTHYFENTQFNAFKGVESIKHVFIDKALSKKEIKTLEEVAKKNGAGGLAWATFEGDDNTGPLIKFCNDEMKAIVSDMKYQTGTMLVVASSYDVTTQSLGAVRTKLDEMFNLASDEFKFVWIENWPLFEYNAEDDRYIAAHHPFTQPSDEHHASFDTNQKEARAKAYDLTLNGFEIGGGSVRIFDPEMQGRMFKAIGMSEEEYTSQFGFFLEAFKYGLPPHAGIAFGVDRVIMLLTKSQSIREVIAFPKNAKGVAVMENSPSEVSEGQLDEYFIKMK